MGRQQGSASNTGLYCADALVDTTIYSVDDGLLLCHSLVSLIQTLGQFLVLMSCKVTGETFLLDGFGFGLLFTFFCLLTLVLGL